ncbi:hypothetical protein [Cytobacillus sp. IB215316]|uniref:hypothetical protein n=1 Tax=Cytobacillus sp. IB215316 TaxID=3097354 RepID=UPI002A10E548|nr:hypothetical protein [Cytobacillus sp. IB215316]MDX8361515.1 hypothetical protein [Cytobacillus sp. IB215316]
MYSKGCEIRESLDMMDELTLFEGERNRDVVILSNKLRTEREITMENNTKPVSQDELVKYEEERNGDVTVVRC